MANAPGLDWDLGFLRNWSAQIAFVGRLGLAFVFVVDGWQAIANFADVGDYMQANGVSARLLPLVIATELGGGLMVVAGFASRWAAIALTGFCLLTALFFHRDSSDAEQVINFQKNVALAIGVAAPCAALAYDDRGPSPDWAAWETFVHAVASAGVPGAEQLEFETWASDEDMYENSPPRWPAVGTPRRPGECRRTFDRDAAKAAGFPDDGCIMEEVRRNWAAFRYLVSRELTSRAGLTKAFEQGLKVDLPADSVQVKADWIRIGDLTRWSGLDEEDIRRSYYTRIEKTAKGAETEYALVGLHLNSKLWKNWIWATFEHEGNPGRCDEIGCDDTFGAAVSHVASREPANQNYGDCRKTPSLIAMFARAGRSEEQ